MKSTAKKLAVCAAAFCLLACGTAVSAAAASPVSGLALSGITMPWDQNVPAESIEVGSYTANMLLGSSQQLSPVVRPRNSTDSVVYISDDTSILTVSNTGQNGGIVRYIDHRIGRYLHSDREQHRCCAGRGCGYYPYHSCCR